MPIEFYCPGCGNLMRTPDETAGRKGRCPTCQLKVQIPANSVASASTDSGVRRSAIAVTPTPSEAEPIRFDCGSCGKTLSIAAANAGKTGKCPHCGELMSIPMKSPDSGERWKGAPKQQRQPSPARSSTPAPTKQPTLIKAGGEKIEFPCSNCHEVVRVGAAAAGKKGQCPRCKAVIQIPLKSASASGLQPIPRNAPTTTTAPRSQSKPAAPTGGLTPSPSKPKAPSTPAVPGLTLLPNSAPASASLPPRDDGGLTPLDDGGLSPLEPLGRTPPGSTPAPAGLTPVGLTPLGSTPAPAGLTPLGLTPLGPAGSGPVGDDPLGLDSFGSAQFNTGDPLGAGVNPFLAPASVPAIPRRKARKGERSGPEIATMICAGFMIFYSSVQLIIVVGSLLFQSAMAFSVMERMRREGMDGPFPTGEFAGEILAVGFSCLVMLTILAGAIQMIRFKVWGLCLAACILMMMPCNCFCLIGIPIGIWGIIMLCLEPVRAAFR